MSAAAQEMARIVVGVKPDQITLQHAVEQLRPHGEDPVDFTAREGRMQKETNADVALAQLAELLAQQLRQQHEVVVMDPDQIALASFVGNRLGKETVGLAVGVPGRLVEHDLTGVVVQEGPQYRV